jgi:hypothetical protein
MPFNEAQLFVIKLNLKDRKEWIMYCKNEMIHLENKPRNIPRDPELRYRKEWINWEYWLTGHTDKIYGDWCSFEEARGFVRNLKLYGQVEWKKYSKNELVGYDKKPNTIPASPDVVYKNDGWLGYGDWLGNQKIGIKNQRYNEPIEQGYGFIIPKDKVTLNDIADECYMSMGEVIKKAKEIGITFNSSSELVSFNDADKITNYILKNI